MFSLKERRTPLLSDPAKRFDLPVLDTTAWGSVMVYGVGNLQQDILCLSSVSMVAAPGATCLHCTATCYTGACKRLFFCVFLKQTDLLSVVDCLLDWVAMSLIQSVD